MSSSAITLVVGVQNEASQPLAQVQQSIEQVGAQAVAAGVSLEKMSAAGKSAALDPFFGLLEKGKSEAQGATQALESLRVAVAELSTAPPLALRVETAAIQKALELAQQPTESSHTIRVRELREAVGKYADGGTVFRRLAAPLVAQGSGVEDDVPALLMRDEFIMRREAVGKYGLGLMYALNEMQLDHESLPRFAAGGAVGAQRRSTAGSSVGIPAPQFDPAQYFQSPAPMALLLSKASIWPQPSLDAFVADKTAQVTKTLDIEKMRSGPQEYVNSLMATFSGGVRAFATGGGVGGATVELENQRWRLNEEYSKKIEMAKKMGNEDIAYLWESQLVELETLIQELQQALESMVRDYTAAVEKTTSAYSGALAEVRKQYGERMAKLQQQLWAANKGMELARNSNELQLQSSGESMSLQPQQRAQAEASYNVQALERAEQNAETSTVASFATTLDRQRRDLERAAESQTRGKELAGKKLKIDSGHDIRKAWLEALKEVQGLEIEWKKAVAVIERQYTHSEITGFSHWLSRGGLATEGEIRPFSLAHFSPSPLRLAQGGTVPSHPGARRGVDSVFAMLAPGEFVINADAARVVGAGYLRYLNSLDAQVSHSLAPVRRFAAGGAVPGGAESLGVLPSWSGPDARPAEVHEVSINFAGARATLQGSASNARTLVKQLQQLKRTMA